MSWIYTRIITPCLLHSYTMLSAGIHHRDKLPDIFHNYFTLNSSVHNYATREKDGLHLFNINTTHGQRSVRHKGCVLLNGLPAKLQQNMSVSRLKTLLKQHLLDCSMAN